MKTLDALLLATGNPGKVRELRHRLASTAATVRGLGDLDPRPAEVPETAVTFAGNAVLKAVGYGQPAGMATLADDSGLEVDALDGAPGVLSARFSGPGATDASNNRLLLERLDAVEDEARTGRFRCALALYVPPGPLAAALVEAAADDPAIEARDVEADPDAGGPPQDPEGRGALFITWGAAEGTLLRAPRGEGGFGYDPLFLSSDLGQTFAEAHDAKKGVSHRGRALDALLGWLGRAGALD